MLNVDINTSNMHPLSLGRGIGVYTRYLKQHLSEIKGVKVLDELDKETKPDIIHYPFFDFFFPTLPLIHAKPVVVTIHDAIPLKYPKRYPKGIKGTLNLKRQKLALRNVKAIITDSFASKTDVVALLGVDETKVHVTPLAGNPEIKKATRKQQAQVKKKYQLPNNFILYVGDINYNKNLPELFKGVSMMDEGLSLVCVGRNFEPQAIREWKVIEKSISNFSLQDRVKFVTQLEGDANQELSAIYSLAKVYIQPSLAEGFGLPVLEAMQAGTLVVCSERSSLIEVGGEHATFAQPNGEDFARAVKQVLDLNNYQREKKVRAASKWAKSFSWEKTAQLTKKVYEQLV